MASSLPRQDAASPTVRWDHTTDERFFEYYQQESQSAQALGRFRAVRETILRMDPSLRTAGQVDVADIGCGAGSQSLLWAELGFNVHGIDVNERLLELARRRSAAAGLSVDFTLGSAVSLPWPDESIRVCVSLELLEHVANWRACLEEFCRVVCPGGILFLTTTNVLCPVQQEFVLPLYSWYPGPVKRHCERLATTTRPQLANYARYPATNWFTFAGLRALLDARGFDCFDRFDLVDTTAKGAVAKAVLKSVRSVRGLRWMAHVATSGTTVLAVKRARAAK